MARQSQIMKIFFYSLLTVSFCFAGVRANAKEPVAFRHSTEMVVVTTPDWNASGATLQRYQREKPGKPWRAVGEPITVVVGKTGLGWVSGLLPIHPPLLQASDPVKKEGDGKAP